jgi:hypothetical protein
MVLNELSDGLKLHAALKAHADMNIFSNPEKLKHHIDVAKELERKFPNLENPGAARLRYAHYFAHNQGKLLGGKRNRLLKLLHDTPEGTKTGRKIKNVTFNGKIPDERVPSFAKSETENFFKMMGDENIHKQYNDLAKELEELNKNNPDFNENDRKFKIFKTKPQTVQFNSDDNNDENKNKDTNEQNQNDTNSTNGSDTDKSQDKKQDKTNINPGLKLRIKRFIDSLKRKYNTIKSNIQNTPPEKRSLLQKFMHKIMQLIDKASGWIK